MTDATGAGRMTRWRRFLCNVLGWHVGAGPGTFDGCSFKGRCRHCRRPVLMDSQGNWFAIGGPDD